MGRWCRLLFAAAVMLGVAPACPAQLTPLRTYYGKDRPIPMMVAVPSGLEGEARVVLRGPRGSGDSTPASPGELAASVAPGVVNMATLFPTLWTDERPRVLYAQLVVGEEEIGPAVVIQPLLSPAYATTVDGAGMPRFPKEEAGKRLSSGIRAYTDRHVVFETDKGEIQCALRPDVAPNTVWNFLQLVEGGFFTDMAFHRVAAADTNGAPYLIQTGDPTGTGMGGPGYYIDLEPSTLPHGFGVVSMARARDVNSGGSQVFICLSRAGTAKLDGQYTAFAQTVRGGEVIQAIASVPVSAGDRPIDPAPRILSARVIDAPPYSLAPDPLPEPGTGPIKK